MIMYGGTGGVACSNMEQLLWGFAREMCCNGCVSFGHVVRAEITVNVGVCFIIRWGAQAQIELGRVMRVMVAISRVMRVILGNVGGARQFNGSVVAGCNEWPRIIVKDIL